MNNIGRYIFLQCLSPLAFTMTVLTAIVWMTQSLQRIEILVENGQSFLTFFSITVLIIPSLLAIITPFALLAASIYALNKLHSDSEIVVMFASGMSSWRIAQPLLLLGALGAIVTLVLNLWLMPAGYRVMKERVADIRADLATGLVRGGEFTTPASNLTFFAEKAAPGGQFTGLLIFDGRNADSPSAYMAKLGLFRETPNGPQLLLKDGNIQRSDPDTGGVDFFNFDEYTLDMSQFVQPRGELQLELTERFLSELFNPDMSRHWDKVNHDRLIAEGHNRLSTPLYNLVYVLIALVAIIGGAYSRRGYGLRIAWAVGAALGVRVLGYIAQSLSTDTLKLSFLQYAVPAAAIIFCLYLLSTLPKPRLRSIPTLRASKPETA